MGVAVEDDARIRRGELSLCASSTKLAAATRRSSVVACVCDQRRADGTSLNKQNGSYEAIRHDFTRQ